MTDESAAETKKDKRAHKKVRSAWIAFVGRIVAQVIGAVATVVLGLAIADRITRPAAVAATPLPEAPARARTDAVWIAVLPLDNFSGDSNQEFLADGMTEALIAGLARSPGLHVVSRTSVMPYKGARKPLPQIARELGVDAVIEGSVVRVRDRVRVTAQLVDAREDRHLWAESYDRALGDLLAVQADVARDAVRAIAARLAAPGSVPAGVGAVEGDGPRAAAVARALPELAHATVR
jgi:TolB-like protein